MSYMPADIEIRRAKKEARRAQVAALWDAGLTRTQIAAALGERYGLIWDDLHRMELTSGRKRASKAEVAHRRRAVAALREAGFSVTETATLLGVGAGMVSSDMHALGADVGNILIRKRGLKEVATVMLNDAGLTETEIAIALGADVFTVRAYLRADEEKAEAEKRDADEKRDAEGPFLREARSTAGTGFCMCLDMNCADYRRHEREILEWTWRQVESHIRERQAADAASPPRSIPFGSVA